MQMNQLVALRKLARFIRIYGPGRAAFKAAGRARTRLRLPTLALQVHTPDIGIIGCGQFAYATIGYFLTRRFGRRVLACFDLDPSASATLAQGLGVCHVAPTAASLLAMPGIRYVFIASNHASHAQYAVAALLKGLDVYVEKPVAVTVDQLRSLAKARASSDGRLFAGYNRPFSPALRALRKAMAVDPKRGITLQCTVFGHVIEQDHWYRRPEEGTRICGNVGHWLDLFIHVMSWRGMPSRIDVSLTWSDETERDENLCIALTTDKGDLCSILLSARSEPFEGISETVELQHGETICKIEDFRRFTLWQGARVQSRRFWPKDPGHRDAIMQPFASTMMRPWQEVEDSTLLMLHITDMIREARRLGTLDMAAARSQLHTPVTNV